MSDPKVESFAVTDPFAPEDQRTIEPMSAIVARLVQQDVNTALAKLEASVSEKQDEPPLDNGLQPPPSDAADRLWKIVRAKVADIIELSRVLQGRGAFAVSDVEKSDEIIAILSEDRSA